MTDAEQQTYLAQNLRDLHLPTDSLWWPLAPGWWLAAIIATLLLIAALFTLSKRYLHASQNNRLLTEEQKLATYYDAWQKDGDNTAYIHRVSTHLRHAAITHTEETAGNWANNATSRATVAKLNGDAWVHWLEQTSGHPFSSNTKALLGSGLYETVSPPPDGQIHNEIAHCLNRLLKHRDSGDKQSSVNA